MKLLRIAMLVVFVFAGMLSASANPSGGVPKNYTFPSGMSPVETIKYFHREITDGEFGLAYDVLTEDNKNFFQSYGDFKNGYGTTLISRPGSFNVIEQTETTARVAYVVNARDWMDDTHIVEQTFACDTVLKKVDGAWLLDSGTGELTERRELDPYQSAAAVLKSYHECITYGEMRAAWNMLGSSYKASFGDFPEFCSGFKTTVSSVANNIVPVVGSAGELSLEYTLTAKDTTEETDVLQVFAGLAQMEAVPGQGWRIMSAENKLVERYFPPKQ